MTATPASLGYRMPAEWEPHQAVWFSWPHNRKSWPGKFETVEPVMVRAVAAIGRSETVRINGGETRMRNVSEPPTPIFMTAAGPLWLTLAEAAQATGFDVRSIRRMIAQGRLPGYRVLDGRAIRVRADDLPALFTPVTVIDDGQPA